MHSHISSVLQGPVVSGKRNWWSDWSPSGNTSRSLEVWNMSDRSEKPSYEPEVRTDLVQRVRREIAAGVYETPEKWEAALDRLLDRLDTENA